VESLYGCAQQTNFLNSQLLIVFGSPAVVLVSKRADVYDIESKPTLVSPS
jgi:hypothetical protein